MLGYETITAFMYEAGFVGLMVFGWGKIGKKMHLFATFNVAVASSLSALWILVANSWMQTPTGVVFKNGFFQVVNWGAAIFNPDVMFGFPHMEVAAIELALCFVAAISAWQILKEQNVVLFQRALKYSVLGAGRDRATSGLSGGWSWADRGGWSAGSAGGAGRPLPHVQSGRHGQYQVACRGMAECQGDGTAWAITIPHVLSLLETHTWSDQVEGLDDSPRRTGRRCWCRSMRSVSWPAPARPSCCSPLGTLARRAREDVASEDRL